MTKIKLITQEKKCKGQKIKLEKVVGQTSAINKLKFFAETQSMGNPIPTFLFTGSHGLGKTYLARNLAKSLERRFVEINCDIIETSKDLMERILMGKVIGKSPCTIMFDEAHRLSSEVTTVLLSMLNPSESMKNIVGYKNAEIIFDMSQINVIFATTDSYKIFNPLVDRCERIYFESYNHDDLIKMLKMYCKGARFTCNHADLANACRGRGRDAFLLAQKINRYLNNKKNKTLTEYGWKKIKNIFEIYPMGLNRQEMELMKIIANNKFISASNLALSMMVNTETVESELEIRPRELGLIKSTSKGRSLTDKGKKYIQKVK